MPTLPNPDAIQRVGVNPSTAIAQYDETQVGGAMAHAGHVIERTAERTNQIVDNIADTQARGAIAELKRQQNQLTIGDDGYARLQNEAALAPGVTQKYIDLHKTAADGISAKLSPLARQKFGMMAQRQSQVFQAGLLTHQMREDLASQGAVYKANVEASAETAGINYNDPNILLEEKTQLQKTVANYAAKSGFKDKALIERTYQDAIGRFHQSVINAYVDADQVHKAEEYFKENKQEMTPERAQAVDNMLKPEMANRIGREVSDTMFQMHLEGKSESAILDEQLKLTNGKPSQALTVSKQLYAQRVNALEADRVKASGGILLDAFNGVKGAGLTDPRLKEIDQQDPSLGLRVRKQLEALAKKTGEGNSSTDKMNNAQLFSQLTDTIRNGEMPEGGLMQYIDRLPDKDIRRLQAMQNSVDTAAGKYKIPPALVNAAMPKSANTAPEKAAFKGFIESRLQEWKDANPSKTPTTDEVKDILNSASEEHVVVRSLWVNGTTSAFEAGDKSTYPKSFGQQMKGYSDDDILSAYAFAQQIRARMTRADRKYSDAEIIALWQKRNPRK